MSTYESAKVILQLVWGKSILFWEGPVKNLVQSEKLDGFYRFFLNLDVSWYNLIETGLSVVRHEAKGPSLYC